MFSRSWPLGVALVHLYEFLHVSKALARNASDVPVQPCYGPGQKFCRVDVDPDQFATIMTCANSNSSFKLFGQSIYFDWSNDKGFQWGNIEAFWGKDKNSGTKGWRFEVALLKEEFTIAGGFGAVVESLATGQSLSSWNGSGNTNWIFQQSTPAIHGGDKRSVRLSWRESTWSRLSLLSGNLKASAKQACPWGLLLTA